MKASDKGLELIKEFEGCVLKSYKCPAGKLTISYGHTGTDVLPGMTINQEYANALLKLDIQKFENAVNKLVLVPINQNQFDALVSFTYNCGIGRLQNSVLLGLINKNKLLEAAEVFKNYNHAKGKELPGLTRRRAKEKELFLLQP